MVIGSVVPVGSIVVTGGAIVTVGVAGTVSVEGVVDVTVSVGVAVGVVTRVVAGVVVWFAEGPQALITNTVTNASVRNILVFLINLTSYRLYRSCFFL